MKCEAYNDIFHAARCFVYENTSKCPTEHCTTMQAYQTFITTRLQETYYVKLLWDMTKTRLHFSHRSSI